MRKAYAKKKKREEDKRIINNAAVFKSFESFFGDVGKEKKDQSTRGAQKETKQDGIKVSMLHCPVCMRSAKNFGACHECVAPQDVLV